MAGTKFSALAAVGSSGGATAWADADIMPIIDTSATTPRKLTRAQLRAQIIDSPADGDMLRFSSTASDFVAATPSALRYRTVATSRYTTTIGGSPSIITMSDTSDMGIGKPVSYVVSAVTYYGVITSLSANASITVAGPALAAAATISSLKVGLPEMTSQLIFYVSGYYGDGASTTLLASDMATYMKWNRTKSYLVRISAVHATAAATTQPKVNVRVNGASVSTMDSNNGLQLSTAGTWVDNTLASINSSNYDINFGEAIEVECTAAGSPTAGAQDLTVSCVFVEG